MFLFKLTEATEVEVMVDEHRTWLVFPRHQLGLSPAEARDFSLWLNNLNDCRNLLRWIHALYTWQEPKGRRRLCWNGCYCALGVATKLAAEDDHSIKIEEDYYNPKQQFAGKILRFDGLGSRLPPAAAKWLGIRIDERGVVDRNDAKDWTFKQIAVYLVETYILPRFPCARISPSFSS